ncbi:MAG: hypothetical protein HYU52_11080 [Acidobacteria bacterium]|nr:hypothetical protein [Acidobacteriota bacterium]
MTGGALLAVVAVVFGAGIFAAWLPVIRELGRPTRLASALLCGLVGASIAANVIGAASIPLSLATFVVPLVAASAVVGWLLCRLPESPGPENAYPGFPAAIVVFIPTVYLTTALAGPRGPATDIDMHGAGVAFLALGRGLPTFLDVARDERAPLLGVLWLLAALPLVASLLAIHAPLRRAWMIAAVWYAAVAMSLVQWPSADGAEVVRTVFATLGALSLFSCAKEPRLVPFASLMLCGAAMTGNEALVVLAAIVAGAFVRDLECGVRTATRRAAFVLAGPALVVALGAAELLAPFSRERVDALVAAIPGSLATGILGLSWAVPLLVVVAMLPGKRHRIASLLPLLAPGTALAIALAVDVLQLGGDRADAGAPGIAFLARIVISMLILVTGLSLRDSSRHARHTSRPVHAG